MFCGHRPDDGNDIYCLFSLEVNLMSSVKKNLPKLFDIQFWILTQITCYL